MEMNFKQRKSEIYKKEIKIMLVLFISLLFSLSSAYMGIENSLLMLEIVATILNVSEWQKEILIIFHNFVITSLPPIVTIYCNMEIFKLNKEFKEVRAEEIDFTCQKIFEDNKYKMDELLEQGKGLSRSELIDFLNTTKAELVKAEKNNKFKCKSPDILMLDYLQSGLEDMLFPSVSKEKQGHSRARKK